MSIATFRTLEFMHSWIDGKNVPIVRFEWNGQIGTCYAAADYIRMTIQDAADAHEIFSWRYDYEAGRWGTPVTSYPEVEVLIRAIADALESPVAITYYAALKPRDEETPTPYKALLKAHISHIRADKALTHADYLRVRFGTPTPKAQPVAPQAASTASFQPDFSNIF